MKTSANVKSGRNLTTKNVLKRW